MLYDTIGGAYANARHPDSRIERAILNVLGNARTVLNVGAGTGSYEPSDRSVVAVEPSWVMAGQRAADAAPVILGKSEDLPLPDNSFDAVLATLTVHHWSDRQRGLKECRRVARDRVVIFTWDPDSDGFWMITEYFPEILELDRRLFPSMALIENALGPIEVSALPIAADCSDGFLGAYWQRPEMYLREEIRSGMSSFQRISSVKDGIARLQHDIESGDWKLRHSDLLREAALDIGYRLVVAKK